MSSPLFAAGSLLYLSLTSVELSPTLLDDFPRRQAVHDVIRTVGGVRRVVAAPFLDDWSAAERRALACRLHDVVAAGGFFAGAYRARQLVGFAAVDAALCGSRKQYADLLELHVAEDIRRRGIGRILFGLACDFARGLGAEALYLSAHSAVETQRFYAAVGCVDAREPQPAHVEREPYDIQLEARL